MNPELMRTRAKATNVENDSEVKLKRMSSVEPSETMHLSRLQRNKSFIDSSKFSSTHLQSNGWSDSIQDVTTKKPPLLSPRGSFKRNQESENSKKLQSGNLEKSLEVFPLKKLTPLSTSSSSNDIRKVKKINELEMKEIKRVQEKSNKFLEALSSKETSPKRRQLSTSSSTNSIPNVTFMEVPVPSVTDIKQNHRQILEDLKKTVNREILKINYMKVKIISSTDSKISNFLQINEIQVAKSSSLSVNHIYKIRTKDSKEWFTRVKVNDLVEGAIIEVHPVLAKVLGIERTGETVEVFETKLVTNLVECIQLIPLMDIAEGALGHQISKDMQEKFKKYINNHTRTLPLVLNQNQILKLDDYLLTVKLFPLSSSACCIDMEILRKNIIDVVRSGEASEYAPMMQKEKNKRKKIVVDDLSSIIKFRAHQEIIEKTVKGLHPPLHRVIVMKNEQNNFIISGPSKSGKINICNEIQKHLELSNINVNIFNCAQYIGRKVDSVIRDMKSMLMSCLLTAPAVFVILSLDLLAAQSHEDHQSQESEYLQKLTNNIRHLIEEFTHDYGGLVSILVTVSKLSNLNKILYQSFGYYLLKNVVKIPNLEVADRQDLFNKLLQTSPDIKVDKTLDWEKYLRITEGYHIGDICQLVDRAIFFAIKDNYKSPLLTEELMNKSLMISNKNCLEGIRAESLEIEKCDDISGKIPGMDNVIATIEEVLIWPTKFPEIFENSPLRNQAGILLFGAPGTGKGFVVSQITKRWNLRLISIKGPELLAKYIGQSEENVRNLFEKAKSARPCVLFFDEFDSLAPRRGHDSTGVTDRVVNQLLTELDGVKSLEGVAVICATSRPDLIDPALLRSGRIDRLVECPLPNVNERLEILNWLTKSLTIDSSIDLKELAMKIEHFSGADIKSIFTTANMNAIEEELQKNDGKEMMNKVLIRQIHLEKSLANTRPSLTRQDIEKYQNLYEKFKNKKSVTTETPKKVSLA